MRCVQPLATSIFSALADRLAAPQQDQEVKEASIAATGVAVSDLGDTDAKKTSALLEARTCAARVYGWHFAACSTCCWSDMGSPS